MIITDAHGTPPETAEGLEALINPTAHFIGEWINENVIERPIAAPPSVDQVTEIAEQCVADAKAEGIEPEEIEAEVGDLQEYIAETLVEENPATGLEPPRIDKSPNRMGVP
jgi:hypothetical protein